MAFAKREHLIDDRGGGAFGRRLPGATQAIGLVASLALVAAVSGIGSAWTDTGEGSWYAGLEQPPWNPPDWLFGPAWGVLYAVVAVAAWLVWRTTRRGPSRHSALAAYGAQLALNLAWTGVFFGLESPGWALVTIAALAAAIALTAILFGRLHRVAGWLLVPYLGWVVFAASINAGVVVLN